MSVFVCWFFNDCIVELMERVACIISYSNYIWYGSKVSYKPLYEFVSFLKNKLISLGCYPDVESKKITFMKVFLFNADS